MGAEKLHPAASRTGLRLRTVTTDEDFRQLKDGWNSLLDISPADNVFLRWEWLWAWWKNYGQDHSQLRILVFSDEGGMTGIAPFYLVGKERGRFFSPRRLMFLGTARGSLISEYLDLICRPGFEEEVARRTIDTVLKENVCDELHLHKMDISSAIVQFMERAARESGFFFKVSGKWESPHIELPESHEEFLQTLSASMRRKIRDNHRRMADYGDAEIRTAGDAEFEDDFRQFVRLHQLRWNSKGMPGSFDGGRFPHFQREVMPALLKAGFLDLKFLRVSGKDIAVLYNIKYKGRVYFFQAGLDTEFDKKMAPGLILHDHCIREAIEGGFRQYDFLLMGSQDQYKKRWAKDKSRFLCDLFLARPGVMKYMALAKEKARRCLRAAAG